ncbi:MAG: MCE family protein [Candidatus Aminicenantes bacterium]|nr:MCE family protein [Candidatus Aminicenantes bacterium]
MKREIKIGIFLALASITMAVFILVVGDIGTLIRKPGYELFLYFDSAAGLEKQTGVRLAGVKIGYVKEVRLKGSQAEVVLSIDPKHHLRIDAKATLAALGILGEKYIEVIPGQSETYAPPGSTIESVPPMGLDQVAVMLAAVGKEIQETSIMLRDLIGTDENKTNIRDILQNITVFSAELKDFSERNKTTLDQSIRDTSRAVQNFDARMSEISRSLDDLITLLRDMAEENRDNLQESLSTMREVVDKAEKSLQQLNEILKKVNSGEGTLGKLVDDPELYREAEQAIKDVRSAIAPASEIAVHGGFNFEYFVDPNKVKSYMQLALWPTRKTLLMGEIIQDPFLDKFTYSLQGGLRWKDVAARAGVMQSQFGAAVDLYTFRDRLRLSLESFDFNRDKYPNFRLFASYNPTKYLYLLFGVDDFALKDRREFFLGLGIGL